MLNFIWTYTVCLLTIHYLYLGVQYTVEQIFNTIVPKYVQAKVERKKQKKTGGLTFLSRLWPILQVIAHYIQDKLAVSFDKASIGHTRYKWFLIIDAKYSSVENLQRGEFKLLEKKKLFGIFQIHHLHVNFDIIPFSYMIKIQDRASHLSAHAFWLFSTTHSSSVTKCHLRMYRSIELFNRFFYSLRPSQHI